MELTRKENSIALLVLTAIGLWFSFEMVQPFLQSIFSAGFIAIAFYPLHEYFRKKFTGESTAALLSTLVVILVFIIPMTLLIAVVIQQGQGVYQRTSSFLANGGINSILQWVQNSPLGRFDLPIESLEDIQAWLRSHAERISTMSLSVVKNVAGNLTALFGNLFFTAFILFFCFRDGEWAFRQVAGMIPLTVAQINRLVNTVHRTMRANVYGILAVGAVQGLLTAITFIALSLPSPIFWGVFASIGSILPPFGAAIVWLPTSIVLMATGSWVKGLILFGVGAGVISLSDNIVRPLIIQDQVSMGTLAVLISILGGMSAFGLIGLFAGPVIFCLTAELLKMFRESVSNGAEVRQL